MGWWRCRRAPAQLGLSGAHAPVRVRRVNPPEGERALLRSGQQARAHGHAAGAADRAQAQARHPAPADPRPETLAAALAGQAAPAAMPQAKPIAASPAPSTKPIVRNTTPMPAPRPPVPAPSAPVAKAPAAKPAPQPVAKPQPQPKPEPKPAPAASHGSYLVQVGAFSTRANAEKAAREVGGSVTPAGKFFRVGIAAGSQDDAKAALGKAKRAGYADARIQRAPQGD
jgi:rare lipoprotein A